MRLGYLSLTNFCPNKCVACPCVHRKYEIQDLSLEHVHESIETAEQEGKLDRLILSGGEPTFNADFLKIMGFLSSRSFPVSITTTSQRFSDISFLKTLLSIFPKERLTITSTIHSFNPEIHDSMTGVIGSFQAWFSGMKNVEASGVKLTVKNLITKVTYKSLPEFFMHYYSEFGKTTSLYICGLDYSGMAKKHIADVFISLSEMRPFLQKALLYSESMTEKEHFQRSVAVLDIPYCALDSRFRKYIPAKEEKSQILALYNAPDSPEPKPRTQLQKKKGIRNQRCETCRVKDICIGTWESAAEVYNSDEFVPIL